MKILTTLNTHSANEEIITGKEYWPLVGSAITDEEYREIIRRMAGLKKHWNCLEKAQIVLDVIKRGNLCLGSLTIFCGKSLTTYGYGFNPPFEFHAWVRVGKQIIDVALPGAIEKGLITTDEYGPYLQDRPVVTLAGIPEIWMGYNCKEVYI